VDERRHPLTPHLVVFAIEVWRTRTRSWYAILGS
jgi:hypothetical protein